MSMMTPDRFLRSMRKTPVILSAILRDVTQETAQTAREAPDEWSVLEIVCHLRDFEAIVVQRVDAMLDGDNPSLPGMDNREMAKRRDYPNQKLADEFAAILTMRRELIERLSAFTEAQWERRGIHPLYGQINMLELAMNMALHDVDHTEQIARALGLAEKAIF